MGEIAERHLAFEQWVHDPKSNRPAQGNEPVPEAEALVQRLKFEGVLTMTHNETRISNERLAEMLAGLEDATPGPWNRRRVGHQWAVEDRHTRYIAMMQNSVDERQGNAAHIARCAPDTIRAMILELQALRSAPVEADHIADAGKMVEAQPIHALPMQPYDLQGNPSPSDGEVSEALRKLAAEVGGLRTFEGELRAEIGNTNYSALMLRLAEADAAIAASSIAPATGFEPQHIDIAHDGFSGDVIGSYITREGKRGFVVQQDGTRVVHVYGEKFAGILPSVAKESGEP